MNNINALLDKAIGELREERDLYKKVLETVEQENKELRERIKSLESEVKDLEYINAGLERGQEKIADDLRREMEGKREMYAAMVRAEKERDQSRHRVADLANAYRWADEGRISIGECDAIFKKGWHATASINDGPSITISVAPESVESVTPEEAQAYEKRVEEIANDGE